MKKIILFGLILLVSCNSSLNKKAEGAMQQYDSLLQKIDAKGISAMYMPDGEMAQPGEEPIKGPANIAHFLDAFKGMKVEEMKSITDSIHVTGDTAIQYGKYYQRIIINNKKVEVNGMFQANWVEQKDGKLLLKRMSAWSTENK